MFKTVTAKIHSICGLGNSVLLTELSNSEQFSGSQHPLQSPHMQVLENTYFSVIFPVGSNVAGHYLILLIGGLYPVTHPTREMHEELI
jgi:hypothetical protein